MEEHWMVRFDNWRCKQHKAMLCAKCISQFGVEMDSERKELRGIARLLHISTIAEAYVHSYQHSKSYISMGRLFKKQLRFILMWSQEKKIKLYKEEKQIRMRMF